MEEIQEQNELHDGLKFLAKSSIIVFLGLSFSKIFTYIYRIIIARNFGPETYGLFSLSIMVLGFFALFFSFGFSEGLLRFVPWYKEKKQYNKIKYILKISSMILIISGILSGILLFYSASFISINIFHNPDLTVFLKVFAFLIPIYLLSEIFLSLIRGFEKTFWYSFINGVLPNVVKVLSLILFILIGLKTNAIIFSYFLGISSILIVSYIVCKYVATEIFKKHTTDSKNNIFSDFFSYSWPLMFSALIINIFYWTDSFLIGYFMDASSVGLYNAAIPIFLFLKFAPELFSKFFLQVIVREFSKTKMKVIEQLSQQVGKWMIVVNIPVFLILFFFSKELINILFGEAYVSASMALKILAVGGIASSLIQIFHSLILMVKRSKLVLINFLTVSAVNIILNIILIPKYGINGAALATSVSWVLLTIMFFFEVKSIFSIIPIKKNILKIIFLPIFPLILLLILKKYIPITFMSLFLLSSLFVLLYILLMFVTNCLDENDFMVLRGFNRRYNITGFFRKKT